MIVFVVGSIRERMPLASVGIHTAPAPTPMLPSLSAMPAGMVATTRLLIDSTRVMVLSSQFGTQTLPNPTPSPAHGLRPTVTWVTIRLVAALMRVMLFLALFEIQTAPESIPTQSGEPAMRNRASILNEETGCWI